MGQYFFYSLERRLYVLTCHKRRPDAEDVDVKNLPWLPLLLAQSAIVPLRNELIDSVAASMDFCRAA